LEAAADVLGTALADAAAGFDAAAAEAGAAAAELGAGALVGGGAGLTPADGDVEAVPPQAVSITPIDATRAAIENVDISDPTPC